MTVEQARARLLSLLDEHAGRLVAAAVESDLELARNRDIACAAARMLELPTTIARMNVGYSWTGHGGLPVMQYNTFKEGRPWLAPIGYSNIGSPIGGQDIGRQAHMLLEVASVPVTRFLARQPNAVGGITIRLVEEDTQSVVMRFFDGNGLDISESGQRKVERCRPSFRFLSRPPFPFPSAPAGPDEHWG